MQRAREGRIRCLTTVALVLAITCLATSLPMRAQDLADERAKVLAVIGQSKDVDIDLFPVATGPGLVRKAEITEVDAKSLRAHFVIENAGESWGVQVKDGAGDVHWSTWDTVETGNHFWSDEVAGDTITVEVFSSRPSNSLQLRLDKLAIGTVKTDPVSITGDPEGDFETLEDKPGWIVEAGRSVARLRFVSDEGKVHVCTAFLVSSDIMLTNEHCIATEAEMKSALVDLDYDQQGPPGQVVRLSALIDHDHALDYSLIRLERPLDRKPLSLDTDRPSNGEQLMIIQHPSGEPKQISLADCLVDGALVTGRGGSPTDFGHQCDTLGGSSGSPVLHLAKRTVIGLHHLGISPGSQNTFNRAVHMDLILEALGPAVRGEIEAGR